MTDTTDIVLAGERFAITTPLTLGQLIDLNVGAALPALPDPQENTRQVFERSKQIIAAGLQADHPEIDAKALDGMRITASEFFEASSVILEIAGLAKRKKDAEPGEAAAGAE